MGEHKAWESRGCDAFVFEQMQGQSGDEIIHFYPKKRALLYSHNRLGSLLACKIIRT
jgi:hypothetical protein